VLAASRRGGKPRREAITRRDRASWPTALKTRRGAAPGSRQAARPLVDETHTHHHPLNNEIETTGSSGADFAKKLAAEIAHAADEAAEQAKSGASAAGRAASGAADALAGEVEALASGLTSAVTAAGSDRAAASKAALKAVDRLVEQFAARAAKLRAAAGAGAGDAAAAFSREANALRARIESGALSADDMAREVAALAASAAAALRAAAASAGGALPSSASLSGAAAAPAPSPASFLLHYAKLWASLGSLFFLDKAIKAAFVANGVAFPSALAGMFGVFALLCAVGENAAAKVLSAYAPALTWIARWLPLFYVPALVTLPLALNGIPGASLFLGGGFGRSGRSQLSRVAAFKNVEGGGPPR